MKIAVVLEYLPAQPWREQWWAVQLAPGLAQRGHEVVVLCDGAHDPCAFETGGAAGEVRVEVRRPDRGARGPSPVRFPRWALRRARESGAEAVLSLSALVPARHWLPIERNSEVMARSLGVSPLALLLEVMEQPMLPGAAALEALRRPASRLVVGAPMVDGVGLGYAPATSPPAEPDRLRCAARTALGIGDQTAILLSATDRRVEALQPALRALGACVRAGGGLLGLTVGPYAHALHESIKDAAPEAQVRHAGFVRDITPVLLAADAVCLPGAFPGSGTGRLAAEALAFGKPILIAQGAPGATLVVPQPSGSPGLVVPSVEARTWKDAMARAGDAAWLERASRAAREAGEGVSMSRLLDRLEEILGAGPAVG